MARLRSPDGCPWDREQTYQTLAPMVIEEAYEVFEAAHDAAKGRYENLLEELGDRASGALQEALKSKPSLEAHRRIEALLRRLRPPIATNSSR